MPIIQYGVPPGSQACVSCRASSGGADAALAQKSALSRRRLHGGFAGDLAVMVIVVVALGLAGAASLLRIPGLRLGLGLLGAAVLTALGARALRNATQAGGQPEPPTQIT